MGDLDSGFDFLLEEEVPACSFLELSLGGGREPGTERGDSSIDGCSRVALLARLEKLDGAVGSVLGGEEDSTYSVVRSRLIRPKISFRKREFLLKHQKR